MSVSTTTSVTSAHHAVQHPESDGGAHDFSSDDGLFNLETPDAARDALPTHSLASFLQSGWWPQCHLPVHEAGCLQGQLLYQRFYASELMKKKNPRPGLQLFVPDMANYPSAPWFGGRGSTTANTCLKDRIFSTVLRRFRHPTGGRHASGGYRTEDEGEIADGQPVGRPKSTSPTVSVSLAHTVYSHASVLLLDDVLFAVDAQTAYHLYHQCLQEDIMKGHTVLLVSHHVHLCTPGAAYIVTLDNGRLLYSGTYDGFQSSGAMGGLVQSIETAREDEKKEKVIEEADVPLKTDSVSSSTDSSATVAATPAKARKPPRKLIEDEKRAVGHIGHDIWEFKDLTKHLKKMMVLSVLPTFSTNVSLLEAVLFTHIRFHNTLSCGRILNRFGKDFKGTDSNLSDNFG
ncbi:hypothetical protein FISHEDRAFT_74545 [Fistulina hepatica ATCC 64428]|uniref:ABC transporter domain-containing protein n=1 Tax=Fistulina hepatica ATCC 64428 TaxID=1128425 RepID=A0A0D7A9V0_9AGAR|nr:hypothetical protein FISHEDRAFT_74545 [Fistulina hepatica ATCC 64428]